MSYQLERNFLFPLCRMNFINNLTYVASIVSWKYNIASIIGWLSRVSNFITIGAQIIKGPREKHAVFCRSVVHEPSAGITVQIFAECLTLFWSINLSNFLRNEYNRVYELKQNILMKFDRATIFQIQVKNYLDQRIWSRSIGRKDTVAFVHRRQGASF